MSYLKTKYQKLTNFFIAILVFVTIEDLIRRISTDIPASILIIKTILLFIIAIIFNIKTYLNNLKSFIAFVIFLFIFITLPNIESTSDLLRIVIWFNAVIIMPLLIIIILIQLDYNDFIKIFKAIFIVSILASLFAIINYFSGTFMNYETLGGPVSGGFRFYQGQKLYFNSGWFYGAERLSWLCAIGLTTSFILMAPHKKFVKQFPYLIVILFFIFTSFTAARVTGFLLTIFIFVSSILLLWGKKKKWLPLMTIIILAFVFFTNEITSVFTQSERFNFIIEHSSSLNERGSFHLMNIKTALEYAGLFGLGPLPQGLQYLDKSYFLSLQHIQSEGLISLSILQFGIFSIIHISFNAIFILLALRAIIRYNDYKFFLGILLLALKIWVIKASQMETDTFAQFYLFTASTPLIKSYFEEKTKFKYYVYKK